VSYKIFESSPLLDREFLKPLIRSCEIVDETSTERIPPTLNLCFVNTLIAKPLDIYGRVLSEPKCQLLCESNLQPICPLSNPSAHDAILRFPLLDSPQSFQGEIDGAISHSIPLPWCWPTGQAIIVPVLNMRYAMAMRAKIHSKPDVPHHPGNSRFR
jgi:hypothetical protein